ncbi:LysE family translocator [Roseovarius spongiae]|uniref:LysE family translocator n=1 Tax=Roseovarius spongiae TaxID=2320272 RepID=A0A3A8B967_9RHOB|nr:LysE family transporter [Roseovarius spongiae]RKF14685.1 LysE family translocator [Roseovarius spongiae]
MSGHELILLLIAWAVAAGSPGPATLAISSAAMAEGRLAGFAIAAGVFAGSAFWGIAAGAGMSAVMMAHAWAFEAIRLAGAAYLLWLAFKALRRAVHPPSAAPVHTAPGLRRLWLRGALIHVTNPKAVLAWGAVYAIALPPAAAPLAVWKLFALLLAVSGAIFFGYGLLFSTPRIARGYLRLRRGFEGAFALLFGAAGLMILTTSHKV